MTTTFSRGVPTRPATTAQRDFAVKLLTQIAEYDRKGARESWDSLHQEQVAGKLDFARMSTVIDSLKVIRAAYHEGARAKREAAATVPAIPEGRYAVDNEKGDLAFYRVTVSGTGFVSVYVFSSDEQISLPWKQARAVLHKIEEAGLQAATIRFGLNTRVCGKCGRALTKASSREAGIGPVCAARS